MKQKNLLKIAAFLAIAVLFLTGCASANAQAAASDTGTVSSVNVTDSISTSGSLSAEQLSALTWTTSGTVDTVNVKVGDTVKAGDVLAVLKANSVSADIVTAQSDLASAQSALDTLMSSDASKAAAQLAVANAEQAVADAEIAIASLNYPRASDALVANTEAQILQAKRNLALASDRYRLVQKKADGDPVKTAAELAMTNAQLSLNTLISTYNWYNGKPTTITADIDQANLATAQAQLADAQKNWEILKNGPDPVQVAAAKAKVDAAQATVNKMKVIAPFDGVILTVQTAAGDPVDSGSAAFEIVNRNTLKVDALVDETSISAVAAGNSADITMDLLPGVTLKGKVTVISSIGTTVNGLVKYTVTIALEPTDQPVRFGATANVILYTSAPHTLLAVPLAAVQTDSKGEYVTLVKADGTTERITVVSGDLSGNKVTLATSTGLKAGDSVLLGTSSSSASTSSSSASSSSRSNSNSGGAPLGGPGGF